MDYNPGWYLMSPEQSILQKIREKELEISARVEEIRSQSNALIEEAQQEAGEIIERFDAEGKEAALTYYNAEMQAIQSEIEVLNQETIEKRNDLQKSWEKNLPRAVEMIIQEVLSG